MKQFFVSMLGALAGIWISVFLFGLLGIIPRPALYQAAVSADLKHYTHPCCN